MCPLLTAPPVWSLIRTTNHQSIIIIIIIISYQNSYYQFILQYITKLASSFCHVFKNPGISWNFASCFRIFRKFLQQKTLSTAFPTVLRINRCSTARCLTGIHCCKEIHWRHLLGIHRSTRRSLKRRAGAPSTAELATGGVFSLTNFWGAKKIGCWILPWKFSRRTFGRAFFWGDWRWLFPKNNKNQKSDFPVCKGSVNLY